MSQKISTPSVWGGTMIIAGTTIGAGMLALPTISAGMWSQWAIVVMIITWLCLLLTSKALLEVNLHYEPGANFHSLVKDTLGPVWNVINGFSLAFVLYILLYAYISGGSSTVNNYIESSMGFTPNRIFISILFALILSLIIWISTKAVDRISSIMMIVLGITFLTSMSGMSITLQIDNLLATNEAKDGRLIFMWAALSTYLTSFAFHCSVPSLVKYFGKEPVKINKCLVYGTSLAIICYTIWLLIAQGNISRGAFKEVIAAGGNVGTLVRAANTVISSTLITRALDIFAFMALTTSFLGAGLGLFDYIADLLKFDNSLMGRTKTALITFIPPMIGGVFFPEGFIDAIAWAGFFCVIWAVIVPVLMLLKVRKKFLVTTYTAFKSSAIPYLLIIYGLIVAICHILSVFKILPEFQ